MAAGPPVLTSLRPRRAPVGSPPRSPRVRICDSKSSFVGQAQVTSGARCALKKGGVILHQEGALPESRCFAY